MTAPVINSLSGDCHFFGLWDNLNWHTERVFMKGPAGMKLTWTTILWTLLSCLFTGIIIISIGFGAAFPPIDLVARPFVCPDGEMEYVTQEYHPSPVETVTTITWYCVDGQTGARTELGVFPISLSAGTIYGLILFFVALIGMAILGRRTAANIEMLQDMHGTDRAEILDRLGVPEQFRNSSALEINHKDLAKLLNNSGTAKARMKELKELRDANLISGAEYEEKRAEILKEL